MGAADSGRVPRRHGAVSPRHSRDAFGTKRRAPARLAEGAHQGGGLRLRRHLPRWGWVDIRRTYGGRAGDIGPYRVPSKLVGRDHSGARAATPDPDDPALVAGRPR